MYIVAERIILHFSNVFSSVNVQDVCVGPLVIANGTSLGRTRTLLMNGPANCVLVCMPSAYACTENGCGDCHAESRVGWKLTANAIITINAVTYTE
jgi:hypothetical protein